MKCFVSRASGTTDFNSVFIIKCNGAVFCVNGAVYVETIERFALNIILHVLKNYNLYTYRNTRFLIYSICISRFSTHLAHLRSLSRLPRTFKTGPDPIYF